MRLSRYFLPILRETPKEAEIVSHRLMLRAGMMRQEAAGIYAFLPLGLRVLDKICRIVREEQNRSGAIELLMPTIQSADLWRESGRYDAYGPEMLRIKDRHERDMLECPGRARPFAAHELPGDDDRLGQRKDHRLIFAHDGPTQAQTGEQRAARRHVAGTQPHEEVRGNEQVGIRLFIRAQALEAQYAEWVRHDRKRSRPRAAAERQRGQPD